MRIPKYLSPTSVKLFYQDVELFYQRYLSDVRRERDPQTLPMSIGSAFDAYVKSYIYTRLFGKATAKNDGYELRDLFEAQVEKHNWDWAWKHGERVFNAYKEVGCLNDLLLDMNTAIGPPRFEFAIEGEIEGVPLLGKPDIFFINEEGARVIYDWKVNGYCSKALKSPARGYVKLRELGKSGVKQHKDCHLTKIKGIMVNVSHFLEDVNEDWAAQLAIYSWLLGEPIGSEDMVTGIDQICGPETRLRFATHRLRVSPGYQDALFTNVQHVWDVILSGHIFKDLSEEDSAARCQMLDNVTEDPEFDALFG